MYRGCAIPVTWHVLPAADRGLYASWLFEAIQRCQWHPFLRINGRIFFRPKDEKECKALHIAFQQSGSTWSGVGTWFKTNSLDATLLVRWVEVHEEPWLILTDCLTNAPRPVCMDFELGLNGVSNISKVQVGNRNTLVWLILKEQLASG